MTHQLKIARKFFEDIKSGIKTFEVRKNDRGFRVGDLLELNEIIINEVDGKEEHTGRCCVVYVRYILDDAEYCKEGYVVLGIYLCEIKR